MLKFLSELADSYSPEVHERYRCLYGGKATNLAKLIQSGYRVPMGFVIGTEVFKQHMLALFAGQRHLNDPRRLIAEMVFSADFIAELKPWYASLGGQAFAVRSSSSDEDSQDHSYAGLQESVIGISTFEAFLSALKTVWQSFYAHERLMYPSTSALDGSVPSMAVVVQAYVEADTAGVVFTQHPIDGDQALLINVSWGQGTNVVDGKSAESLSVPRMRPNHAVLSEHLCPEELETLVACALAIEHDFESPQDIEFAFHDGTLFVLQTRQIAANEEALAKADLFSNTNVGEALSGVATPMTWSVGMSFAALGFETIFKTLGLKLPDDYRFVTTFYGHIYLNVSEILSTTSQVPFMRVEKIGKILGVRALSDFSFDYKRLSRWGFLKRLPLSFLRLSVNQARLFRLQKRAEEFKSQRDAALSRDLRGLSLEALSKEFDQLNALFMSCGEDMILAGANFLLSYFLTSQLLHLVGVEAPTELETYLFSGLLDVESAAPGLALLDLAVQVSQKPELSSAFLAGDVMLAPWTFLDSLEEIEGGSDFLEAFSDFLLSYGARANQEAELANPRWREDPSFLLQVIASHLRADKISNSERYIGSARNHRQDKTSQAREQLSLPLRPLFRSLLSWAQRNARLRESWRSYVVDMLGILRRFFLACGDRMLADGLLGQRDDVFFLSLDEVKAWFTAPESLADARLRLVFRRARHTAYLTSRGLPDSFVFPPSSCPSGLFQGSQGEVLSGLAASPGSISGRVRVLNDLSEAPMLEHGEIIVTLSTDVGWTPLFLLASAILTERGGPLSHAFVVAREYGIPAVVSIPNLMSTLKTGDLVAVSGQRGTITILERA